MDNPLKSDLDHILAHTQGLWDELRGRRLFITGGTGFFGCWLLESLAWANDKLGLNVRAVVLTRKPEAFAHKAPHLANHPAISFHAGDIRNFAFPEGPFSHVIHAATEASVKLNAANPLLMFDTIVAGTRRALDFAVQAGAGKVLLASSGAVYGRQPPEMTHIPEGYHGGPDPLDTKSAYGEGKRAAELLCGLYAKQHGLEPKIARGFAFVGPYLPLDAHFAVGNFIRDGLRGGPIQVKGDGTPYRSYLYAADLAIWLWTILCKGEPCRPYNVGSENGITIAELAHQAAGCFHPAPRVAIAPAPGGVDGQAQKKPERYVPSVQRCALELGLRQTFDLREAIRRTVAWRQIKTDFTA
ncbi:MAG: NAD-dependent epimerase/dehydratase family protein [Kiritimatiellia bacterium]|jgi:dTDP-glucose 4,6-dehydratase